MSDTQALISDFVLDLRSKHTRSSYRRAVTQFDSWLRHSVLDVETGRGRDILDATRSDIRRWIAGLSEAGLADASVRVKKAAVCGFYKHLHVEGLIEENPAVEISAPKGESAPRLGLTVDHARSLLEEAEAHSRMAAALVWLMAGAGLRVEEACTARIEDLTGDLLTVTVKGGHRQIRALSNEVLEAAGASIGDRRSGPIVIDGDGRPVSARKAQRLIDQLAQRAGIPEHVSPHILRHTAATLALEGTGKVCDSCGRTGSPIEDVSALLGHRSIETTLRYVRNRDVVLGTRRAAAGLGRLLRGGPEDD